MTSTRDRRDSPISEPDDEYDAGEDASELAGHNLAVGYPGTDDAVVECSHVVLPAGEITALVGPNGSGKSTLLRTLAGQLAPWVGSVTLDGDDVHEMADKPRARRVGLLSQERDAPVSKTVEELVVHGRYPYRDFLDRLTDEDRRAVARAIASTGIDDLRDRELGSLSGGQKQLAWIAMILAQEPDVLLLDEPTTFLDLHHQLRVLETIRELNRDSDVTVGVVLHDIAQAARHADTLIALQDGEPYDWGPPTDVVTEALLDDVFGVEATVRSVAEQTVPEIIPHRPKDD